MIIVCRYDGCNHQQELDAEKHPNQCPMCYGHWLEEGEDYVLVQGNHRLLTGCSLTCMKTQAKSIIKISNQQNVFGRTDFDFIGNRKSYISRTHFRFAIENNQLYIEDLGSTNGTFIGLVNREPVKDKTLLKDNTWLVLGEEEFLVKYIYEYYNTSNNKDVLPLPQKVLRCLECTKELGKDIPTTCEYCGTWNE